MYPSIQSGCFDSYEGQINLRQGGAMIWLNVIDKLLDDIRAENWAFFYTTL